MLYLTCTPDGDWQDAVNLFNLKYQKECDVTSGSNVTSSFERTTELVAKQNNYSTE